MNKNMKLKYWLLIMIAIICIIIMMLRAPSAGMGIFMNSKKDIEHTNTTESLETRVEENYGIWAALIEDTAFSDLCSDVYAKRFEDIADEFIECYKEFDSLDEDETTMENYKQYKEYFTVYRDMGKSLHDFTKAIRESRYDEAITKIEELRTLNREIPILQ